METIIRPYLEKDLSEITNFFNEVVREGKAFLTEYPVTIDEMGSRIKSEVAAFVSLTEGQISGCYIIKENLKGRGRHIANATYFVGKKFQGRGVGTLLGEHSLRVAKELGFKAMQFNSVAASNSSSIKIWQKLGFETIGKVPEGFRLNDDVFEDTLILYKRIN